MVLQMSWWQFADYMKSLESMLRSVRQEFLCSFEGKAEYSIREISPELCTIANKFKVLEMLEAADIVHIKFWLSEATVMKYMMILDRFNIQTEHLNLIANTSGEPFDTKESFVPVKITGLIIKNYKMFVKVVFEERTIKVLPLPQLFITESVPSTYFTIVDVFFTQVEKHQQEYEEQWQSENVTAVYQEANLYFPTELATIIREFYWSVPTRPIKEIWNI